MMDNYDERNVESAIAAHHCGDTNPFDGLTTEEMSEVAKRLGINIITDRRVLDL